MGTDLPVLIVGAGIAGLTAGLALADRRIPAHILERAPRPVEAGAGLQLSPNATRILARLGIVERLGAAATRPAAIEIRSAASGRTLATLPLGDTAERRWGAPYLVAHRADLHAALLAAASDHPEIAITTGTEVSRARREGQSVVALTDAEPQAGRLLIAADGVWSALRRQVRAEARSAFSGHIAWRATLASSAPAVAGIAGDRVTVFLHHRFHLVAYPLRGGSLVNLVAVIAGAPVAETWENPPEGDPLESAFAGTRIDGLAGAAAWTVWPLHEVDSSGSWTSEAGIVLAGDAAHAMTPFAAQGAAMAIEDGLVLAECLAQHGTADPIGAARRYEAIRRPRVARVARRSAFNRFAWHAAGPVALARDLVLAARSGTGLMRDLDWLYGFNAGSEPGQA